MLADENIPGQLIRALRALGHDIVAATEAFQGIDDQALLKATTSEQRLLVTEDQGFGDLVIRRSIPVAGLIILQLRHLTPAGYVSRAADAISSAVGQLQGKVTIIESGRTRSRPLPPRPAA